MVADSIQDLWAHFAATGCLQRGYAQNSSSSSSSRSKKTGAYGGVSVGTTLAPGQTATVTVVLAWHFPHRWHFGEQVGNNYNNHFGSSAAAAAYMAANLPSIVSSIAEWNAAITNNDLSKQLRDFLVNSISTIAKTGIWYVHPSSIYPSIHPSINLTSSSFVFFPNLKGLHPANGGSLKVFLPTTLIRCTSISTGLSRTLGSSLNLSSRSLKVTSNRSKGMATFLRIRRLAGRRKRAG